MLAGKRVLLVIGGGIAACKALELIKLLRDAGAAVVPVLTRAGAEFVTPRAVAALAGARVHEDPFEPGVEAGMGHVALSRSADLVVAAPATADLMAKVAGGHADDLESALLMTSEARVLIAPVMDARMWQHPATQRDLARLQVDGVRVVGPDEDAPACGGQGPARMAGPAAILSAIAGMLGEGALRGRHVLVTSGPTHEPIDPVRYIANRSSGAQGAALAAALRDLGARVSFVTGPASVAPPAGVKVIRIETARQMLEAALTALPADAAVFAAAVADWRVLHEAGQKLKKGAGGLPVLEFAENPDVLATVSRHAQRPALVVGFAAETENVVAHAQAKRLRKGCDWIVANDVSPATGIMGGDENAVHLITAAGVEDWPRQPKAEVARRLAGRIAAHLGGQAE